MYPIPQCSKILDIQLGHQNTNAFHLYIPFPYATSWVFYENSMVYALSGVVRVLAKGGGHQGYYRTD